MNRGNDRFTSERERSAAVWPDSRSPLGRGVYYSEKPKPMAMHGGRPGASPSPQGQTVTSASPGVIQDLPGASGRQGSSSASGHFGFLFLVSIFRCCCQFAKPISYFMIMYSNSLGCFSSQVFNCPFSEIIKKLSNVLCIPV